MLTKGYTDYCTVQYMPVRGLPTLLHMHKCKWLDKETGEIFSYNINYEDDEGTRLSAEFANAPEKLVAPDKTRR